MRRILFDGAQIELGLLPLEAPIPPPTNVVFIPAPLTAGMSELTGGLNA